MTDDSTRQCGPGDIANGHRLGEDGQWYPLDNAPLVLPRPAGKPWFKRPLGIVGIVVGSLLLLSTCGAIAGASGGEPKHVQAQAHKTPAPDEDKDGVPDSQDAFPTDAGETTDENGNNVGDNAEAVAAEAKAGAKAAAEAKAKAAAAARKAVLAAQQKPPTDEDFPSSDADAPESLTKSDTAEEIHPTDEFDRAWLLSKAQDAIVDIRTLDVRMSDGIGVPTPLSMMSDTFGRMAEAGVPPGLDASTYLARLSTLQSFAADASEVYNDDPSEGAAKYSVIRKETGVLFSQINKALGTNLRLP